jgi:hypothetical protein
LADISSSGRRICFTSFAKTEAFAEAKLRIAVARVCGGFEKAEPEGVADVLAAIAIAVCAEHVFTALTIELLGLEKLAQFGDAPVERGEEVEEAGQLTGEGGGPLIEIGEAIIEGGGEGLALVA